jgi:hypothetical protein
MLKFEKKWIGMLTALFLAVIMIGCGTPKVAPSGFLSDYSQLRPDKEDDTVSWWEKSNIDWRKYNQFILDPVVTKIDRTQSTSDMTANEITKLATYLREAVANSLSDRYPIVENPGPDVMRIRAAITHLKPVSGPLNVISTTVLLTPIDAGEAALEAQFIDSETNEILCELTISSRGSLLDLARVWTRWHQVRHTFNQWGQKLRIALDEVH